MKKNTEQAAQELKAEIERFRKLADVSAHVGNLLMDHVDELEHRFNTLMSSIKRQEKHENNVRTLIKTDGP